ncbi:hypothetical protein AA11825_0903 [Acetobacter pomorum DSM 11825]|nr:hypothetical protein AA11825_0903 [Acetobacter pomorum DSM 11825]
MEKGQALFVKEKMAYGYGDAASNMTWGMTSSYLMYYYTDIYSSPLVVRVVDAFCDPAIGYIVDRIGGLIRSHSLWYNGFSKLSGPALWGSCVDWSSLYRAWCHLLLHQHILWSSQ